MSGLLPGSVDESLPFPSGLLDLVVVLDDDVEQHGLWRETRARVRQTQATAEMSVRRSLNETETHRALSV